MKRSAAILVTLIGFAIQKAAAQSPAMSIAPPPDTLERFEGSAEHQKHEIEIAREKEEAQKALDSLFQDHEQILKVTRSAALKEWEIAKAEDAKTLKELKEEEIALRKELKEEQKRSEDGLRPRTKRSFNRTKYEATSEEER